MSAHVTRLRYGPWEFDASLLVLVYHRGKWDEYEVDVELMKTAPQVLDWIAQVAGKTWATAEVVGSFVLALDDLLKLQENYCGHGTDLTVQRPVVPARLVRSRGEET